MAPISSRDAIRSLRRRKACTVEYDVALGRLWAALAADGAGGRLYRVQVTNDGQDGGDSRTARGTAPAPIRHAMRLRGGTTTTLPETTTARRPVPEIGRGMATAPGPGPAPGEKGDAVQGRGAPPPLRAPCLPDYSLREGRERPA